MQNERFKSLVALLVAVVTILGASAACLATAASSGAADADFKGVAATIKGQKALVANYILAFEHKRAFTDYFRYNETGFLLYDEAVAANTEELTNLRMEAWGLADAIKIGFFPPRYIDISSGYYNVQRELDELWAADTQSGDLNPSPHFTRADALRGKSLYLTGNMIAFATAFWFLTLAQVSESRIKYLFLVMGTLTALAGTLILIYLEVAL